MKVDNYYIYMLTNRNNKMIYVGMINDRARKIYENQNSLIDDFTKTHKVNKLVYYEAAADVGKQLNARKKLMNGAGKRRTNWLNQ